MIMTDISGIETLAGLSASPYILFGGPNDSVARVGTYGAHVTCLYFTGFSNPLKAIHQNCVFFWHRVLTVATPLTGFVGRFGNSNGIQAPKGEGRGRSES